MESKKQKVYLVSFPINSSRGMLPKVAVEVYDNKEAAMQHLDYEPGASITLAYIRSVFTEY